MRRTLLKDSRSSSRKWRVRDEDCNVARAHPRDNGEQLVDSLCRGDLDVTPYIGRATSLLFAHLLIRYLLSTMIPIHLVWSASRPPPDWSFRSEVAPSKDTAPFLCVPLYLYERMDRLCSQASTLRRGQEPHRAACFMRWLVKGWTKTMVLWKASGVADNLYCRHKRPAMGCFFLTHRIHHYYSILRHVITALPASSQSK
jgi:hypothetical protein